MTAADLAGRLAVQGLDRPAVAAAAAVFDRALTVFAQQTSRAPAFAWWVPGRIEVFGKHTDYAGGRSLVAALPRGFAVLASPRPGDDIHVVDAGTGETAVFEEGLEPGDGWRQYARVVIARLTRDFPGARRGADIVFASNLPRAAGMSSSSALVVGLATALTRVWALDGRPDWRRNIPDLASRAVYYASVENGYPFGDLAGDSGVGTLGGSEDHAAMLLAAPGRVSAFAYLPLRPAGVARVPHAWRFVVATSGVAAEKIGRAREAYNRASAATAALLQIWNARFPRAATLGEALASDDAAGARLRGAIRTATIRGWTADQLERRLDHFQQEDARVPQALAAMAGMDGPALARLAAASQADAEHLLRNQIRETAALVRSALASGAVAASSFGAGFGGSAWAIITADRVDRFPADWLRAYGSTAPGVEAFVAPPGPPLGELTPLDFPSTPAPG